MTNPTLREAIERKLETHFHESGIDLVKHPLLSNHTAHILADLITQREQAAYQKGLRTSQRDHYRKAIDDMREAVKVRVSSWSPLQWSTTGKVTTDVRPNALREIDACAKKLLEEAK